jgi:hypothetical protein
LKKKFEKKFLKIIIKNYKLLEGWGVVGSGGEGRVGWRIVIPMPKALNCVEGRRQKWDPVPSNKDKVNSN